MNTLEWTATVVLAEVGLILLILLLPVLQAIRGPRPPEPEAPPALPLSPGVPEGEVLKTLSVVGSPDAGDTFNATYFYINTPNAIYNGWRFDRLVEVRAKGVRFTNCWFEGVNGNPRHTALVRSATGLGSFTATYCTMKPKFPNDGPDCMRGSNVTASFCDLTLGVDGMQIYGDGSTRDDPNAGNVSITDCWFHEFPWYDNDSHSDGTHNDIIEITGGSHIRFERNRCSDVCSGGGIFISQAKQPVSDVIIRGNSFENSGGRNVEGTGKAGAGINVYDGQGSGPVTGLVIEGNSFLKGAQNYPIIISGRTIEHPTTVIRDNIWTDGTSPAPTVKRGS